MNTGTHRSGGVHGEALESTFAGGEVSRFVYLLIY